MKECKREPNFSWRYTWDVKEESLSNFRDHFFDLRLPCREFIGNTLGGVKETVWLYTSDVEGESLPNFRDHFFDLRLPCREFVGNT
jgi:hypothetical protein